MPSLEGVTLSCKWTTHQSQTAQTAKRLICLKLSIVVIAYTTTCFLVAIPFIAICLICPKFPYLYFKPNYGWFEKLEKCLVGHQWQDWVVENDLRLQEPRGGLAPWRAFKSHVNRVCKSAKLFIASRPAGPNYTATFLSDWDNIAAVQQLSSNCK
jgi:hypothetical protein